MEVDVRSSVLLPIADEVQDTPNLTHDQMSAYTRAIADHASGSSATTYPYPQHQPRVFDDDIARALSDALNTHLFLQHRVRGVPIRSSLLKKLS